MTLDLTEHEWHTVMLALANTAAGHKARDPELRDHSALLGHKIRGAVASLESVAKIVDMVPVAQDQAAITRPVSLEEILRPEIDVQVAQKRGFLARLLFD